jgi:hypothetical protein
LGCHEEGAVKIRDMGWREWEHYAMMIPSGSHAITNFSGTPHKDVVLGIKNPMTGTFGGLRHFYILEVT